MARQNGAQDPAIEGSEQSEGDRRSHEDQLLADYAQGLAEAVANALPGWVSNAVARRLPADQIGAQSKQVLAAGEAAVADVGRRVSELLALDIDEQWTNPLTIIRSAIRYPNEILEASGVAPVDRDEHSIRFLPEDRYDLAPTSFADLGPDVHNLGISWGAAKAHIHLRRRRDEELGRYRDEEGAAG